MTKALELEAETGEGSIGRVLAESGVAPMARSLAAKIDEALRRREMRARAGEQPRGADGRFAQ